MNKSNIYILILIINVFILNYYNYTSERIKKAEVSIGKEVPITGNIEQLKYFFDALDKSKSQKIRIAHYGDSIIWGDVITDNLRVYFQKKYGGYGIGFISICNDDIRARKTISHQFSDDWEWASVFTKNRNKFPIGLAGTVAKPSSSSNVIYKSQKFSNSADSFSELSIFYSNTSASSTIKYTVDNEKSKSVKLSSQRSLNVTKLKFNKNVNDIKLDFEQCEDGFFYGVTLDSGNGVYVDNFPFRGNSGVAMRDLADDLLPGFSKNLNYKLVILQFGVNIVSSGKVRYKWYERMMLNAIEKIHKYFPETSILVISPGDLGQKNGKKMITHPEIKKFTLVQEEIAKKGNVAFWNMFEAMGGENSITNWVNASPPLAFKDYCHLTWDGGDVISKKIIAALAEAKLKIK